MLVQWVSTDIRNPAPDDTSTLAIGIFGECEGISMTSVNVFDDMVGDIDTSSEQTNLHGDPVHWVLGADCSGSSKGCFSARAVI
jgi:hypothetical protein